MDEDRQCEFYALLDAYNQGIEPLENWLTSDLVKLAHLIDVEIQNREYNATFPSPFGTVIEDEFSDY